MKSVQFAEGRYAVCITNILEYLINQRGLDSAWITTYRTTFGGLVMLIILSFKMKGELFKVWKNKKDSIQMVIFGLFGAGMNLYFYMLAVQHTNAPHRYHPSVPLPDYDSHLHRDQKPQVPER